jgi:hypothetical protein
MVRRLRLRHVMVALVVSVALWLLAQSGSRSAATLWGKPARIIALKPPSRPPPPPPSQSPPSPPLRLQPPSGVDTQRAAATKPTAVVMPDAMARNVCASVGFVSDSAQRELNVAIFVFAWRRLASLRRLVDSLLAAEYCGGRAAGRLSLTFLVDVRPSPAVVAYVHSVEWAHGPKRVVLEQTSACEQPARDAPTASGGGAGSAEGRCGGGRGIRGMWMDAMARQLEEHEPPNAHPLPLEDDVALSPLYFWWLRRAVAAYGPTLDAAEGVSGGAWLGRSGSERSAPLVGISLYSPRLDEIAYPSRHWRPRWRSMAGEAPAMLMQLPCSWGALFVRAHWRRFVKFYAVRAAPPFYNFSAEAYQRGKLHDREVCAQAYPYPPTQTPPLLPLQALSSPLLPLHPQ